MTKDEWSAFLLERIQHHVHECAAMPDRNGKIDAILSGNRWPSGWNLTHSEAAVIFGVVHNTMLDTLGKLEELSHSGHSN
ncbi:MAG: hypothetical protein ABID84_04015 [Chloroflexota bacterium]